MGVRWQARHVTLTVRHGTGSGAREDVSPERVGEGRSIEYHFIRIPFWWNRYGALLSCPLYYCYTFDVSIPEPPDLSNRGRPRGFDWNGPETLGSEDFYREDIENLLQEGAWREGFEEWAEYTDLDEAEFRVVDDLDLFQACDFYRDPTDDHLRFDASTLPEDWRERDVTESLDSSSVSAINRELHDLGRAVHERLQNSLQRTHDVSDRNEEPFGEREE